jgi:hypothetical protein
MPNWTLPAVPPRVPPRLLPVPGLTGQSALAAEFAAAHAAGPHGTINLGQLAPTPGRPGAPSAPPPPAPLPPDPAYLARIGALANDRDHTIAGLAQQRGQGLLQYGYTEGPGGALTFDAANPFSQAALLKRNYDNARTGNTTSLAARGQLYAGSLQNAQNETGHQQQVGEDQLQRALLAFIARNDTAVGQAGVDYQLGASGALGDSIARAPDSPLYSPVVVDTGPAAAAGAAAAATARIAASSALGARRAVARRTQTAAAARAAITAPTCHVPENTNGRHRRGR